MAQLKKLEAAWHKKQATACHKRLVKKQALHKRLARKRLQLPWQLHLQRVCAQQPLKPLQVLTIHQHAWANATLV